MTYYLLSLAMLASFVASSPVNALAHCPSICQCDDNNLTVKCNEGSLDVLPIALNPFIQHLIIRNNKIKTIDASIGFYRELKLLDLSHNNLVNVPSRTFENQRKLLEMHLPHNEIAEITNRTFVGLSSLKVLNLRGNLLAELEARTFAPLAKLEELDLGQNRISSLDVRAFEGLISLHVLYLDDNTLTSMPASALFATVPNLAELYLAINAFESVVSYALDKLPNLLKLDLRGTGLHNISSKGFSGLKELKHLDISDNRLAEVPTRALTPLTRLEVLNVGQNDFMTIPTEAFAGLKNLRRLEIVGANRLQRIEGGAFSSNMNLETLTVSYNKMLNELDGNALEGLPRLKHLSLRANAFRTLSERLFDWAQLSTLDVSENPLVCDCQVMWLTRLAIYQNSSTVQQLICAGPGLHRGTGLWQLSPDGMGCHRDLYGTSNGGRPHRSLMLSAVFALVAIPLLIVASFAYFCRRRLRDKLKCRWGDSALGRKEQEYQRTCCDDDYMSRQTQLGSTGATVQAFATSDSGNHQPNVPYMGVRLPTTEL